MCIMPSFKGKNDGFAVLGTNGKGVFESRSKCVSFHSIPVFFEDNYGCAKFSGQGLNRNTIDPSVRFGCLSQPFVPTFFETSTLFQFSGGTSLSLVNM